MSKKKPSKSYGPSFTERIRSGELTLAQAKNICDQANASTRRRWVRAAELRQRAITDRPQVSLLRRIARRLGLAS